MHQQLCKNIKIAGSQASHLGPLGHSLWGGMNVIPKRVDCGIPRACGVMHFGITEGKGGGGGGGRGLRSHLWLGMDIFCKTCSQLPPCG